eukprot:TRINITY_DN28415_c0_g1_i1.p1 TRINITY_DN28415_c0_g1~~TRINITY_DN28415_c0_g1_i1.p1  ORF type:complete len:268 (+),score=56.35 TRINITY_DN28415_c0_g1_i1:53-805(+)
MATFSGIRAATLRSAAGDVVDLPVSGPGGSARLRIVRNESLVLSVPAALDVQDSASPATEARNATDLGLCAAADAVVLSLSLRRILGAHPDLQDLRVEVEPGQCGPPALRGGGRVLIRFGGKWGCQSAARALSAAVESVGAGARAPTQAATAPPARSTPVCVAPAAPAPRLPDGVRQEVAAVFEAMRGDLAKSLMRRLDAAREQPASRRAEYCAAAYAFVEEQGRRVDAVERSLLGSTRQPLERWSARTV